MFLEKLVIRSSSNVIREVKFNIGLNLIIDETPSTTESLTQSGNNVGKSTVLRLINYCLGGDEKKIYQDPEFKDKENTEVKNFLLDNNIWVELSLTKNLKDQFSDKIHIRRNFASKKEIYINDKPILKKDFDLTLKSELLDFTLEKPTFKMIKARHIRDDAERLENTIKVLGSFGKPEEYESLYLFWFGIHLPHADEKQKLLANQKIEQKLLEHLRKDGHETKIHQFLEIINRDIDELERLENTIQDSEVLNSQIYNSNIIRNNLNNKCEQLSLLELKKELILESQKELKDDRASIDLSSIKNLYESAKQFVDKIHKTFEETIVFHNQMIEQKISFLSQELPKLEHEIFKLKEEIRHLSLKQESIEKEILAFTLQKDFFEIKQKLNEFYERKGHLAERFEQISKTKNKLLSIESDLKIIDQGTLGLDEEIQSLVSKFNIHLSSISQNLYNEKFALSASFEERKKSENRFYHLSIDSLSGRSGTGKKKGEIAAFDLASIRFADEQHINTLHFLLYDQLEVVHGNQIIGIYQELLKSNCQIICPILKDKIPKEIDLNSCEILRLSQSDKLFKI